MAALPIREQIMQEIDGLTPAEQEYLLMIVKQLHNASPKSKTGAEIVAWLASEDSGWEDMGIEDGAVWVEEQRQLRRERLSWH